MNSLGRLLQIVAMVVLPVSMLLELSGSIGVRDLVLMLVFGASAFYVGRIIEGYARR